MIKKDKIKVYVQREQTPSEAFTPANENLFDMWVEGPLVKTSPWFRSLSPLPSRNKNAARAKLEYERYGVVDSINLNMRSCPPVRELLSRTMLLKAPTDIHFASVWLDEEGNPEGHENYSGHEYMKGFRIVYASDLNGVKPIGTQGQHKPDQFDSDKGFWSGFSNLKIGTDLQLSLPKGLEVTFMHPFLDYPDAVWHQIPGIFGEDRRGAINIIWNVMIPNDVDDFIIPEGKPLMYLVFNKPIKRKQFVYAGNVNPHNIWKKNFLVAAKSWSK